MCRIAAYLGSPISLRTFMREHAHSLYKQSWAAKELVTATVNADGYGVAWLADDAKPALYRNIMPVWADPNLPHLERCLHSKLWLGNVRSATEGLASHMDNTQPFADDRLMFTHNGFIGDFPRTARRPIRAQLDADIEADIRGSTDSEYLFALLRQQRCLPADALSATHAWLRQHFAKNDVPALLNIVVSDGASLVALRAAFNIHPASLYYHPSHPGLSKGAVVASERFDDDPGWHPVPQDHLLTLTPGQAPTLEPL